jgi:hypothetical protein
MQGWGEGLLPLSLVEEILYQQQYIDLCCNGILSPEKQQRKKVCYRLGLSSKCLKTAS